MSNSVINVIYHHDDPDGHVAAMAAAYGILEDNRDATIRFFAKQYTDEFDNHELIVDGDDEDNDIDLVLYYVDLSFTKNTYLKMVKPIEADRRVKKVIWIDHHASSSNIVEVIRDELEDIGSERDDFFYNILFSTNASGALLTWAYVQMILTMVDKDYDILDISQFTDEDGLHFISLTIQEEPIHKIGFEIPDFLYHVDNYDRWTKKDPDADAFITGLKLEGYQTMSYVYLESPITGDKNYIKDFFDIDDKAIIEKGKIALDYQKQVYLEQSDLIGFMHLGPYKVAYKFAPGNSWNFNDLLDKNEVDIGMLIRYDPNSKLWVHSFYGNAKQTVKCNELAEVLGGGGHPGAAGCQIEWPIPTNFSDVCQKYTDLYTYIGKPINENPIQYSQACLDELAKNDKLDKIFLGGTCNLPDNYEWDFRKIIASHLSPDKYFNPVVEDWNEQAQKLEDEMKAKCLYHLYVIYPTSHNTYSLIEIGEALATMENRVAVIVVKSMKDDDGHAYTFGEQQMHAFEKLANDNPHNVYICGNVEMMSFTLSKVIADFLSMMDASKTFVDILNNMTKNN